MLLTLKRIKVKIMCLFLIALALLSTSFRLFANVNESILPAINDIYNKDFGKKVNYKQKELTQHAIQRKEQKIRIMTNLNFLFLKKDIFSRL